MPLSAQSEELIRVLTEAVGPIVADIERQPALTKDHYDAYMSAITRIAKRFPDSVNTYLFIGIALQRAGASPNGVQSALRAMGHI